MGCDIHCYIEYCDRRERKADEAQDRWRNFGGRINPGRHYGIFAKLAGVRNYYEITPIASPRGLPTDCALEAESDNKLFISENSDGEGYCSPDRAARWVEQGSSKYVNNRDGKPTWVTHPDWHSHSWCSAEELETALRDPKAQSDKWAQEYYAIIAALRSFEQQGYAARLVFWFDN